MCLSVLDAPLAHARFYILGENASRSSESLSPERGFEACSDVGLTRSPSERSDSWAKCSKLCLNVGLA